MERITIEELSRGDFLHRAPPPNPTREEVVAWLDGIWRWNRAPRLCALEGQAEHWQLIEREAAAALASSPGHMRHLQEERHRLASAWLQAHMREIEHLRSGVPPTPDPLFVGDLMDIHRAIDLPAPDL